MRIPMASGTFYSSEQALLKEQIQRCFTSGPGLPGPSSGKRTISSVIVPHAGYMYSGTCAAHSFKAIAEDGLPEAYIVIGPDHVGVPYEMVMSTEDYCTPLGVCPIHQEIAYRLREFIPDDPLAHCMEHSIEVELPFIQVIDPNAKIVPIIMGRQDIEAAEYLARAIKTACAGHDVVIVASSDLVHYTPKISADQVDAQFLRTVASGNVSAMYDFIRVGGASICGYGPIATAMIFSSPGRATILNQTDSFESAGLDKESVVGYGSAVFSRYF